MTLIVIAIHVLVSVALILIVLLQTGRGASLGASFGGASQTVFGSRGPTSFMGKLTTAAAIIFMITSLSLAYLSSKKRLGGTVMPAQPRQEMPAAPAQPAPPPTQENPAPTAPAQPPAGP